MKRAATLILSAMLLLTTLPGCPKTTKTPAQGTVLYVSPDGEDGGPGSESGPLATLAGARDRIREIKAASGLPEGGFIVYFRAGVYAVTETVCFSENDSGTESSPIRYAAYPGETPVFTGGAYISGAEFERVTDASALSRLRPEARNEALCFDLFANGFTIGDLDYSRDFWQAGNLREYESAEYYENDFATPRLQVFIDDDALYPARYPNKVEGIFADNPYNSYLMIQDVVETGFDAVTEQPNGRPCAFRVYDERIRDWENLEDIIVFGMTGWEFFRSEAVVESIDAEEQIVTLRAAPASGVMERGRYAFANVFEELDRPGEYYIDRNTGILYLYPTKSMADAVVKLPLFEGSYMIKAEGASYLTFSGLTFELTKKSVMRITGGECCAIESCVFKNFSIDGVVIGEGVISTFDYAAAYGTEEFSRYIDETTAADNGLNHRVAGCAFLNTGRRAAVINSGSFGRRVSGGAVFENNTIRHSGLIGSCYFSGLHIAGCGITVRNNTFLFCLGQAISGDVVDTEIVYNEFCDCPCDMAEDTAAVYLNYLNQNDGVLVRYNYFHDITNRGYLGAGFGFARRSVVGYDNLQPFRDFSYNVVYNAPCAGNLIDHISPATAVGNIFIDVDYALEYPGEHIRELYGGEPGYDFITSDSGYSLSHYYSSGLYADPLWREYYPDMYAYYEYMANEKSDMRHVMSQVCDNIIVFLDKGPSGRATELPEDVPVDPQYGRVANNRFFYGDPGFADADAYDFQLSGEAAALYGAEWLDMSVIGAPGGLAELTRAHERAGDPLRNVSADMEVAIQLIGTAGGPNTLSMLTIWREVVPGEWAWFGESALGFDGNMYLSVFPVKPGGTYAVYYPGDAVYCGQFMGCATGTSPAGAAIPAGAMVPAGATTAAGMAIPTGATTPASVPSPAGEPPPDGVATFTAEPGRNIWDLIMFELTG